jgi:biotin-dependent carboxylase-like uncharacterized protein
MPDCLVVEDPGLFTTLQDAGRFGYQRFGISPSGAMDRDLVAIANALVANPPGDGVLEITMTGPTLEVACDSCRLALAGDQGLTVNGAAVPGWTAVDVVRGDRVRIPPARSRLRTCLAVAGGFAVSPTLGSLSTHTRTRIGGLEGRSLAPGDRLPLRAARPVGPRLHLDPPPPPARNRTVRVVAGPQADAFTEAGWETFLASTYTVSARSDRMGCQLDGPVIAHRHGFNIVSDGIVEGSIQVPGSGRPIVLLADRQTTGGYTKIATVIGADLAVFAHLRPGDPVRFSLIDVDEAIRARAEARASLDRTIRRIGPAPVRAGVPDGHDLLAHNLVGGMVSATADPFDGPTSDPGADP